MCLVSVSSPLEVKLILRDPKPHPKSHWQVICLDTRPLGSQKHSGPAFQRLRDDLPEARGEDQTSLLSLPTLYQHLLCSRHRAKLFPYSL